MPQKELTSNSLQNHSKQWVAHAYNETSDHKLIDHKSPLASHSDNHDTGKFLNEY